MTVALSHLTTLYLINKFSPLWWNTLQCVYQLYLYFLLHAKVISQDFSCGINIFFRLVAKQCRRKTMCSRSDHKVSHLWSGTKDNLRICLLNTKSHSDMEQLMSSFYFLIMLGRQYRKVQEMQIFGIFQRQLFAGAGEAKGDTLMHSTADK